MSGKVAKHDELKKFILNYVDDLYRYAMSLCHNHTDAEDLVSNMVLKATESAENLHAKCFVRVKFERKLKERLGATAFREESPSAMRKKILQLLG